jgi:hypothetical protein
MRPQDGRYAAEIASDFERAISPNIITVRVLSTPGAELKRVAILLTQ